jgi:hypothetical protein
MPSTGSPPSGFRRLFVFYGRAFPVVAAKTARTMENGDAAVMVLTDFVTRALTKCAAEDWLEFEVSTC